MLSVYFSCPQLEEGTVANRVNLLLNGDFSYTTTNKQNSSHDREFPDYWTKGDGITTAYRSRVISPHDMDLGLPEGVHGKALQLYSRMIRGRFARKRNEKKGTKTNHPRKAW